MHTFCLCSSLNSPDLTHPSPRRINPPKKKTKKQRKKPSFAATQSEIGDVYITSGRLEVIKLKIPDRDLGRASHSSHSTSKVRSQHSNLPVDSQVPLCRNIQLFHYIRVPMNKHIFVATLTHAHSHTAPSRPIMILIPAHQKGCKNAKKKTPNDQALPLEMPTKSRLLLAQLKSWWRWNPNIRILFFLVLVGWQKNRQLGKEELQKFVDWVGSEREKTWLIRWTFRQIATMSDLVGRKRVHNSCWSRTWAQLFILGSNIPYRPYGTRVEGILKSEAPSITNRSMLTAGFVGT